MRRKESKTKTANFSFVSWWVFTSAKLFIEQQIWSSKLEIIGNLSFIYFFLFELNLKTIHRIKKLATKKQHTTHIPINRIHMAIIQLINQID